MERALRILRTRALCAGVSLEDVEELAEAGQGEVSGEVQQEGQEGEGGEAERPDGVLRLGEHAPNVEDDTLQGVDIGDGWLRYWDVGESAHFFFHMETGETRWVAPGEEDEYEAGEGQEGQEEGGAAGDAAAAHEEGGGVGFGQVGGEGEWAREYGGKAFPAGAWAALGDSAAAPKYLDPEGENAGSKYVPPAATRCTYPDGYNWDAYAAYNGFRSGQEAYFQHYYPSSMQAAGVAADPQEQGGTSTIIYTPEYGKAGVLAKRDAAVRLDRILGSFPGQGPEDGAPAEEGLTEAQKIFGTADSFTSYAKTVVIDRSAEAALLASQSRHEGPVTAESIKASADAFVAAQRAGGAGGACLPQEADLRKHGQLAMRAAQDRALLAAVHGTMQDTPASRLDGGHLYGATATFNKRTGRFEGAGAVNKMDVGDSRRQTSHFFDHDKWTEEKQNSSKGKGKRPLGL